MDVDSSSKFIGSLTKFLQSLCNGYVEFQRGVELVGHIYLSIDTGEKVDYILHEKVSKNDENSVTFVSNSFHAQPQDIKEKEKEKASASKNTNAKSGAGASGLVDTSDDDDIMIVDQTKGVPGSTNSGTIPSRGTKRVASPSPDQRQAQRNRNIGAPSLSRSPGSSNPLLSPTRNLDSRQQLGGPSATITSRDAAQENLNMADVKLEQISRDELLSLATQVGEGGSGPSQSTSSAPRPQLQRSGASAGGSGDAASWIKQEAADDNGGGDSDTGWSQGRDDSNSNSGSNLYPVMLHQNPAAYSNPVFPGFSGSNTSSANPYANPVPGTSQDMGGLDPSEGKPEKKEASKTRKRRPINRKENDRRYRERMRQDPVRYQRELERMRERYRRQHERLQQKRQATTQRDAMEALASGAPSEQEDITRSVTELEYLQSTRKQLDEIPAVLQQGDWMVARKRDGDVTVAKGTISGKAISPCDAQQGEGKGQKQILATIISVKPPGDRTSEVSTMSSVMHQEGLKTEIDSGPGGTNNTPLLFHRQARETTQASRAVFEEASFQCAQRNRRESDRLYRERLRQDPERYRRAQEKARERQRRRNERRRQAKTNMVLDVDGEEVKIFPSTNDHSEYSDEDQT